MHSSLKEQVNGLNDASTENDSLRVIEVHNRCQTITQVISCFGDDFDDQFIVAFNGVSQQSRTNDCLSLFQLIGGIFSNYRGAPMMNFGHNGLCNSGTCSRRLQTTTDTTNTQAHTC